MLSLAFVRGWLPGTAAACVAAACVEVFHKLVKRVVVVGKKLVVVVVVTEHLG